MNPTHVTVFYGSAVVYDPATQSWGIAEQVNNREYAFVCHADSLATALRSM